MNCNKEQNRYHIFCLSSQNHPHLVHPSFPLCGKGFLKRATSPGFLPEIQVRLYAPPAVLGELRCGFLGGLYPRRDTEPDSPKPILTRDYLRSIYPGSPQPLANRKLGISWD